jgi:hypothetical protein
VTIETPPKGEGKKKGLKTSSLLHATFQHNFFVHLEMLQKKKKKRSSQDLLALLCFASLLNPLNTKNPSHVVLYSNHEILDY